jgi:hypothetical protein
MLVCNVRNVPSRTANTSSIDRSLISTLRSRRFAIDGECTGGARASIAANAGAELRLLMQHEARLLASFTVMGQPSIRQVGGLRIAYLTGAYPRATDTFIQREVAALRERGVEVHTFAVRRPAADQHIGPAQAAEAASTTYLLPASAWVVVRALAAAGRHPRRFLGAAALARRTHPRGVRGALTQCAYFLEAAVLARQLRRLSVQHVHNHFPDSSGTVAMLAAHLAGVRFSFTMHGAEILRDVAKWRLDEKVARAAFGVSVSWYGRAQAMLVSPPEAWPRLHVVRCGIDADQYPAHPPQRPAVAGVVRRQDRPRQGCAGTARRVRCRAA